MKLRKLCDKDIPGMLEWMQDPEINKCFRFTQDTVTPDSVRQFIATTKESTQSLHLACVDSHDEYLGTISLKNIDHKDNIAEYAVSFRKMAQGTGAASFATKAILRIAFEDLLLERVYLNVLEKNSRACRFYDKMGFVFEGVSRSHICLGGKRENLRWYAILRPEWEKIL